MTDVFEEDTGEDSEHDYLSIITPLNSRSTSELSQRREDTIPASHSISLLRPTAPRQKRKEEGKYWIAYKNLKIQLGILIIANLVILAIFVWTVLFMNVEEPEPEVSYVRPYSNLKDNFKLCTKCDDLQRRYGGIESLIKEIRSIHDKQQCCFRKIAQFLDLLSQHSTWYVDKNYKMDQCKNQSDGEKLRALSEDTPLIHCSYKKPNKIPDKSLTELEWLEDPLYRRYIKVNNNCRVTVPFNGHYYIYSSISYKSKPIHHYLYYKEPRGRSPVKLLSGNFRKQICSFQGVFKLRKGGVVYVTANQSLINNDGNQNYFGMYLVQKLK